jgi:hypothetical protein
MKISKKILAVILLVSLPALATAQEVDPDVYELYDYVGKIYSGLLLPIGSILAGFVIMWGGITYATSAGDATKIGRAKELIIGAISGEVLLLCAWAIVRLVNS